MLEFKQYNVDTETYLKFLECEALAHRMDRATHGRLHDEAVDALRRNVHQFNLQVRMYKARADVTRGFIGERRH